MRHLQQHALAKASRALRYELLGSKLDTIDVYDDHMRQTLKWTKKRHR